MVIKHKLCPTCGLPWMRSDDPKTDMIAVPSPLFDTETVLPGTEQMHFFQRPIGQNDASGALKLQESTSMFMAGCLPTPQEFKGIGMRWMTDADPDRVCFELSRGILCVNHGMDRLLCVVASRVPLGKLNETSYKAENKRSYWHMDMTKRPFYPLSLRLRWGECFSASLCWPKRRPELEFKLRLAFLGHIYLPKGW